MKCNATPTVIKRIEGAIQFSHDRFDVVKSIKL